MDPFFNEFLHVPARLSMVALLAPANWVEFGFLRDTIGTSDSALSKQISALTDAGYVWVRKSQEKGTRRTYVQLTPEGRQAFERHAAALERIVAAARAQPHPPARDTGGWTHGSPAHLLAAPERLSRTRSGDRRRRVPRQDVAVAAVSTGHQHLGPRLGNDHALTTALAAAVINLRPRSWTFRSGVVSEGMDGACNPSMSTEISTLGPMLLRSPVPWPVIDFHSCAPRTGRPVLVHAHGDAAAGDLL